MNSSIALLQEYFGYASFRQQQEEIIETVLAGNDAFVLMPTGGGKSLCYQIPALAKAGTAIVISPLIALMKDQVESLRANGISAIFLNSSLTSEQESENIALLLQDKIKLLYLSPEKAIALSGGILQQITISLIAIDEAHCISQWGHDFRPEYAQLKKIRKNFPHVPLIALTATADKVTRKDICKQLDLDEAKVFISSFDRHNLHLSVKSNMPDKEKMKDILQFIEKNPDESGIIYCLSRKGAENMCQHLKTAGIDSAFYHAGMSSQERSAVQENFIFDRTKIICATIAFGMGIDKSNVRWIIHFNLPKNMESYYQEIGRAGRDGLPSKTILYYTIKDLMVLSRFAADSGQVELNLEKLNRIQQYAEATNCRRKILLGYFGEILEEDCNNCDRCENPARYIDGTVIAQKAISCVLRTKETIGFRMLTDILRGLQYKELRDLQYHLLKTHGIGKDLSSEEWQHYILQMLHLGIFEMAYDEGFSLKVSSLGKQIVFENKKIELAIFVKREKLNKKEKAKRIKQNLPVLPEQALEQGLFDTLKAFRRKLALQEGYPPYIIFHDNTLVQMVNELPTNKERMLKISGVSHIKYEKYGIHFEKIIREFTEGRN